MIYDIEITGFAPDARTSRTVVSTADEPWDAARAVEARDGACCWSGAEGSVSYGDSHIWLAADRALVRLDEHRDSYAMDAAWAAAAAAGETWFTDTDGPFPAQIAETISRSQAFEALGHWLRTGEMLPSLIWA